MKNKSFFVLVISLISLLTIYFFTTGCAVNGEISTTPKNEKKSSSVEISSEVGVALDVTSMAFSDEIPIGEGQKYNVRSSFRIALRDWLEYKFGEINENALDEVKVEILSINYDGGNNTFLKSISTEIRLTGDIDGIYFDKEMTFERSFSRSTLENPDYKGSTLSVKAKTNLDRYLMQFVEKIKGYLKENVENLE